MSTLAVYSSRAVWLNISTITTFGLIPLSLWENNTSVWLQNAPADEEIWKNPAVLGKQKVGGDPILISPSWSTEQVGLVGV